MQSRDAHGSATGLQYRWDFESSYVWTDWSGSTRAQHQYKTAGDTYIRLQVMDSAGMIDETSTKITVRDGSDLGPYGYFTVAPAAGTTDTEFVFTPVVASGAGAAAADVQVRWDYEGRGVWDTPWTKNRSFAHVYVSPGSYEPVLQMLDVNGAMTTVHGCALPADAGTHIGVASPMQCRVEVTAGTAPQASYQAYPVQTGIGGIVHFDPAATQNATQYRWDFDGDGVWDTPWDVSNRQQQYTFGTPGVYHAVLAARNAAGQVDYATTTITVVDDTAAAGAWLAPKLTVRDATANVVDGMGVVGDEFILDATGSKRIGNQQDTLTARFDYDGDGVWDTAYGDLTARYVYRTAGDYTVRVEIRSGMTGATVVGTALVRVVKNTPPVTWLTITPSTATQSQTIAFDASGSFDDQSNSGQLMARFDFNGDGVWDTDFSTTKRQTLVFPVAGHFHPKVEIRDLQGLSSVVTGDLTVMPEPKATAVFMADPATGTFDTKFSFDASAVASAALPGKLQYRWQVDSGGPSDLMYSTSWQESPMTTAQYSTVGSKLVRLTTRNAAGELADYYQVIHIHPASADMAYMKTMHVGGGSNPDEVLTRAEFTSLLVAAAGVSTQGVKMQPYADVAQNSWYAPAVVTAVKNGWMAADAKFRFRPDDYITRASAVAGAVSALYPGVVEDPEEAPAPDVPLGQWYTRYSAFAIDHGLLPLYVGGALHPGEYMTVGDSAMLLARLMRAYDAATVRKTIARRVDVGQQLGASLLGMLWK